MSASVILFCQSDYLSKATINYDIFYVRIISRAGSETLKQLSNCFTDKNVFISRSTSISHAERWMLIATEPWSIFIFQRKTAVDTLYVMSEVINK